MIKLLLRGITNPHGMIAQAIIKLIANQFSHWGKYVDEDNELDIEVRKLAESQESLKQLVLELAKDFHSHESDHALH